MTTLMDLRCFLCKDQIPYSNNDKTDFARHMNNEHMADFGIDFLLAACLMEDEEKEAIQEVVGDKFQIGEKFSVRTGMEDDIYDNCVEENMADLIPEITLDESEKELANDDEVAPLVITDENVGILNTLLNHSIFSEESLAESPVGSQFELSKEFEFSNIDSPKLPMPTPIETPEGFPCPECGKVFKTAGNMKYHFTDIHQPGEFPCIGCQKMFTSKNKMSSHYSRYCNSSNKPSKRRRLADVKPSSVA